MDGADIITCLQISFTQEAVAAVLIFLTLIQTLYVPGAI